MNMLRSIREKKGLTIGQLAARASIPARVLTEYEEGRQPIPLPHAKLIAKALWVPIEELMPPGGPTAPPAARPASPPPATARPPEARPEQRPQTDSAPAAAAAAPQGHPAYAPPPPSANPARPGGNMQSTGGREPA